MTAGIARSGVMAVAEGAAPGPTIAPRADMDALPIDERSNLAHASNHPGRMHDCGHDGHMAMLRAAAEALRHLDHLISRLGEAREGPGSDFDGARIPLSNGDAAGLQRLAGALAAHGYDRPLVERLFLRDWLAVLERT